MHNALRAAVVFAALAFASVTGANAFTIQEVTSPGGIKAWLVEEHAIPLMAMNYSFKGGTERDPAGKEGVSEFLTGMLDEGAGDMLSAEFQTKRDELAFRMRFDAGSDFFEGSVQTLTKNRDASTDLLKLAITAPRFDAEPLERVRQQFLLNVKEQEQDPSAIGWQAWMNEILPGDPYSRPDDGTEASISGFSNTMLENNALTTEVLSQMREQIKTLGETQGVILQKLGAGTDNNGPQRGGNPPIQEPYQEASQYNESAS